MADLLVPLAEDEPWRRRLAATLLHGHIAGRALPEKLEGLTGEALVDRLARMQAKELLETLSEIYEVDHWDAETFARVFIEGALEGWKPGNLVRGDGTVLHILNGTCPIADDVERDPRACAMCQGVQTHAARLALRGDVVDASFSQLISRGDGACQLDVTLRPRGRKP